MAVTLFNKGKRDLVYKKDLSNKVKEKKPLPTSIEIIKEGEDPTIKSTRRKKVV